MVSEYEAVKLQRDMHHELAGPSRAVEKCAAGLVLLALIAAVGTYSPPGRITVDVAAIPMTGSDVVTSDAVTK